MQCSSGCCCPFYSRCKLVAHEVVFEVYFLRLQKRAARKDGILNLGELTVRIYKKFSEEIDLRHCCAAKNGHTQY